MLQNIKLLVRLRWIAIICQMAALGFAIIVRLPVNIPLFIFAIGIQTAVNLVTFAISSHRTTCFVPALTTCLPPSSFEAYFTIDGGPTGVWGSWIAYLGPTAYGIATESIWKKSRTIRR